MQRQGRGVYISSTADRYEGDWFADQREGTGVIEYANGDRYEGEMLQDMVGGQTWFLEGDRSRC